MAHRLAEIKKRLEQGLYGRQPEKVQTNLDVLQHHIIDKAGVWKKTKEEARVLSEQIRGMSERVDVADAAPKLVLAIPAAAPALALAPIPELVAASSSSEVAAPPAPEVAAPPKQSIAERLQDMKGKLARGIYKERPEELATNIGIIDKMEKVVEKASGAGQPALLADIRDLKVSLQAVPVVAEVVEEALPVVAEAVAEPVPVVVEARAEALPVVALNPCSTLYDPCTREPLSGMPDLERRVREIKASADTTPVGLYGLQNATTNYDFLRTVFIDPTISLDDMVSFKLGPNRTTGSDIFEVLSRLFVFFGGIKGVNPKLGGNFNFVRGIERGGIWTDPKVALQSMQCIASRGSGLSDITLTRIKEDGSTVKDDDPICEVGYDPSPPSRGIQTYLMSVKWYKKEKNAEHYDLEKLFTLARGSNLTVEQKPIGIIVFLRSKEEFQKAHNRAFRQYVKGIGDTFFGWEEDLKPFLQEIRRTIFEHAGLYSITPAESLETQYFQPGVKPFLTMYLHQDIIVKKVCDAIESPALDKRFLVGVLPRGGKTFIAGGIVRELLRRSGSPPINIFWITAAPTETKSQVEEDLLNKYQDFADFEFIDAKVFTDIEKKKKNTVIFCSSQLLTLAKAGQAKKRDFITRLLTAADQLGLVFFDEAHKTGTGEETTKVITDIIDTYSQLKLPFIFLTGTYYNILFDYKILTENTFIWDYTDVMRTRGLGSESENDSSIANLQKRFGVDVSALIDGRVRNGESLETMGNTYIQFPDLYFVSADFQEEAIERFQAQSTYRPDSGFSLNTIFALRRDVTVADVKTADNKIRRNAYRAFENLVNPRNIISLLTPAEVFPDLGEDTGGAPMKKEAGAELEPTLLGRINAMSRDAGSRFRLDENPTLLMFMPVGGVGSHISLLLPAWASLLLSHPWWEARYEIACVVDDAKIGAEFMAAAVREEAVALPSVHMISRNPKSEILTLERKLKIEKGKGLVILAGEKLSMGISLPCTDVVFLFNDKKSPDDIIQNMYRALTPSRGKKAAFVVDLNPVRTLAAVYGYTRAANETKNSPTELLDIIYDTYSWDSDVFTLNLKKGGAASPLTFQEKLRQMFAEAERDESYKIHEDFGGIEKQLATNVRTQMDSDFMRDLTEHFSERRDSGGAAGVFKLHEGGDARIDNGKLVIRTPAAPKEEGEGAAEANMTEIVIDNFVETLGDFVKYLAITSESPTLEAALGEYETSSQFATNVNQMLYARTDMKGLDPRLLRSILITAVKKYIDTSSRMFRDTRGKVFDSGTRKNAVLKIINKRLTPRQKQKKDHGEVFTPLELVNEMLDHLPKEVWKNPELTWLDPANGIGNFPVAVFYRLDEGLKEVKPNATARRKHIIENMLYMMELQSGNSRIAKNIFMKLCEGCTPNIWTTDTLKVTPETIAAHGWPTDFDIVMGNPPFQDYQDASGKRGGGDELYMTFVGKSLGFLKQNGFLVFVHPPSWRKPEFSEGRKVSKNKGMFELMTHENQMLYLEIHNSADGQRVFKAGTRYDFYTLQKKRAFKPTLVKDEVGKKIEVDLREQSFLPNYNIENILELTTDRDEDRCTLNECILYSASAYESRKTWVRQEKTAEFKYPLIHTTPKTGPRLLYSNTKDKGFFGIPKVIFGDSGINEPVIDVAGEYGMTQHSMAIAVKNERDAERLATFLKSNYFTNILSACMWSSFQIDWRLFTYFKNNFWHADVSLDEPLVANTNVAAGGAYGNRRTRKARRIYSP